MKNATPRSPLAEKIWCFPTSPIFCAPMFEMGNIENGFFLKLGFSFDPKNLKSGQVLISEPFLRDPNFARSVILIADYKPTEGAVGFILNKPSSLMMDDVMETFPKTGFAYNIGGPVCPESLFYIHRTGQAISGAKPVVDDLLWAGNFEEVRELIVQGKATPANIKFFGGYSGWSPGQLEEEIRARSWIIGNLDADQVMGADPLALWKQALRSLGSKFSIMAGFPENPQWN